MITLKNFLEKFVGHNSEIILFDEEKDLQYRKEAQKKIKKSFINLKPFGKVWIGKPQTRNTNISKFIQMLRLAHI